ncbi:uncharacterized protein LOC105437112 [Strongylocentrotus purpuratus]|uniref:COR domain-containing protein n=1 Tax=Strongylocentrotus purpuratus TaxID=7668 RepID=A0A7M7NC90_STRPU|nr:uncharacterized protein LOC105437112 [Strongylocentrotus purpuratus]
MHRFNNNTYIVLATLNQGETNQLVTGGADGSVKVLSTSGNEKIAIISKAITHEEITNVKSSELGITYSMWDFGGQEIYYITHPLFLSWRALYILVIPLNLELSERAPREEDAENAQKQLKGSAVRTHRTILDLVNFWLMSVYTHAVPDSHLDSTYEPKVLIIGTFSGGESTQISKKKLDSKVQELMDLIGSKPYRKQVLFPICVIDNQFSQRSEARSIMTSLGISDNEMDDVLQFYHDIGHLIYHQGCELIVLQPQFLNSIVSNIITVIDDKKMKGDLAKYWTDLLEKGILSIELIQDVWEEHKGVHDQLNDIIDMMIIFDLICEIPDMHDGRRRFFVPCRSSPMLHDKECYDKDHTVEFTIDFHHFLPDGFLHRFYVRMAKWSMKKKKSIKPTFHCREMVFYVDSRHRLVMTNEINSTECHQIKVNVNAVVPFSAQSERKPTTVNLNENELIPIKDILTDQDEFASCDNGCPIDVSDFLRAFNKGTGTSLGKTTPRQGASAAAGEVLTSKARSHKREVTDAEIGKLSKLLPDGKCNELCGILGFDFHYIQKIKKKNPMDSTAAFEELLQEWKVKGESVGYLDAALVKADLKGLVPKYKN